MIESIKIKIGDVEVDLPIEAAKQLGEELAKLFEGKTVYIQPAPIIYEGPPFQPYPTYPRIWCTTYTNNTANVEFVNN